MLRAFLGKENVDALLFYFRWLTFFSLSANSAAGFRVSDLCFCIYVFAFCVFSLCPLVSHLDLHVVRSPPPLCDVSSFYFSIYLHGVKATFACLSIDAFLFFESGRIMTFIRVPFC